MGSLLKNGGREGTFHPVGDRTCRKKPARLTTFNRRKIPASTRSPDGTSSQSRCVSLRTFHLVGLRNGQRTVGLATATRKQRNLSGRNPVSSGSVTQVALIPNGLKRPKNSGVILYSSLIVSNSSSHTFLDAKELDSSKGNSTNGTMRLIVGNSTNGTMR